MLSNQQRTERVRPIHFYLYRDEKWIMKKKKVYKYEGYRHSNYYEICHMRLQK